MLKRTTKTEELYHPLSHYVISGKSHHLLDCQFHQQSECSLVKGSLEKIN